MGKTITERILAKASGKAEVSPGEYVHVSARCPITLGFGLGRGPDQAKAVGATKVFNPKLVNIVDGHTGVTASHGTTLNGPATREWARQMGIPRENIYKLGRQGIEHVLSGERCWALPGEVFFEVVNGHTSTQGALGAFGTTLSYGSGAYLVTGSTWIRVPETAKFNIRGTHDLDMQPIMMEEMVDAEIGAGLVLRGRIDRVDKEPAGTLHIIDYKTGKLAERIDWEQLELHALILSRRLPWTVNKISYLYLGDSTLKSTAISSNDLRQAHWQVLTIANKIKQEKRYQPNPGPWCGNCDFMGICPDKSGTEQAPTAADQLEFWDDSEGD